LADLIFLTDNLILTYSEIRIGRIYQTDSCDHG